MRLRRARRRAPTTRRRFAPQSTAGAAARGTLTRRRPSCTFHQHVRHIGHFGALVLDVAGAMPCARPPQAGQARRGSVTSAYKPVLATTALLDPVDATGYNYSWWSGDDRRQLQFLYRCTRAHRHRRAQLRATGILWRVAQQTSMRDVSVDATHVPWGSTWARPRYARGRREAVGAPWSMSVWLAVYGLRGMASQWLLREVDIVGASVACVWMSSWIYSWWGCARGCPGPPAHRHRASAVPTRPSKTPASLLSRPWITDQRWCWTTSR